ncbi:N-alpha-acetyltransferase 20 [Taxawa tesnikishii (nom. ined.)]|nr:N-alpha-acetyltransferase 20 [Dothideales sp. JES 119]
MSSVREMTPTDLLKFNPCNLDPLTETYNIGFYLEYFSKWPQLCLVIEGRHGEIEGYIKLMYGITVLGKVEASPYPSPIEPFDPAHPVITEKYPNYLPWHAHITCLTVSPASRRLGHATRLSAALEAVGEKEKCWFVDLFVRVENTAAIELYMKMGYSVYRRIVDYYNDGMDAFDMRKPLSRDKDRKTVRPDGENILVDPSEVW